MGDGTHERNKTLLPQKQCKLKHKHFPLFFFLNKLFMEPPSSGACDNICTPCKGSLADSHSLETQLQRAAGVILQSQAR